jgi:hypothetical protein
VERRANNTKRFDEYFIESKLQPWFGTSTRLFTYTIPPVDEIQHNTLLGSGLL